MKDWGLYLMQFGIGGASLGVLAFFGWIQYHLETQRAKGNEKRWEEHVKHLEAQQATLLEVVRSNTDVLRENISTLGAVKAKL